MFMCLCVSVSVGASVCTSVLYFSVHVAVRLNPSGGFDPLSRRRYKSRLVLLCFFLVVRLIFRLRFVERSDMV